MYILGTMRLTLLTRAKQEALIRDHVQMRSKLSLCISWRSLIRFTLSQESVADTTIMCIICFTDL